MGAPLVGDVVVVPFPFSDLTQHKRRPAIVVARCEDGDLILCQVTSRNLGGNRIQVLPEHFANGALGLPSYARPDKLFTASRSIVIRTAGSLTDDKRAEVRLAVTRLFK